MHLCRFPFFSRLLKPAAPARAFVRAPNAGARLKRGRSGETSASTYGLPMPVLWPG